jgi:hypothetical protein
MRYWMTSRRGGTAGMELKGDLVGRKKRLKACKNLNDNEEWCLLGCYAMWLL